jgi:hypothetical protein
LRSPTLARGFSPPSTASLFCDIFDNLNLGERIHLPQVSAAQELQIKAQTRLASLMEEKLVRRISAHSSASICASKTARLPTPIPAETGAMPTHEGLRSNDRDGIENRWKPSIQQDEEQAISVGEVNTTTHLPPQYDQLTSERQLNCSLAVLEWRVK